jgi:hypothetical protein
LSPPEKDGIGQTQGRVQPDPFKTHIVPFQSQRQMLPEHGLVVVVVVGKTSST